MEKQRRKREKRTEITREMRDRGERIRDKIYIYIYIYILFYNTATVDVDGFNIEKKLQFLGFNSLM